MKLTIVVSALAYATSVAAGLCAPCSNACAKALKSDYYEVRHQHLDDCYDYFGGIDRRSFRQREARSLHEIPDYARCCKSDEDYRAACACIEPIPRRR